MKRPILTTVAASTLAITTAYADQGFSVGASIGSSKIDFDDAGVGFDGSDFGWKIFGRYMFNDNFGIEGGYIDFGKPDDSVFGTNVEIDADGFDLFAVGAIQASQNFDLFGKAGVVSWDADFDSAIATASDDGTDLALGVGGAYSASDQVSFRGEWEWFDVDDTDAVWLLSVGVEYHFN